LSIECDDAGGNVLTVFGFRLFDQDDPRPTENTTPELEREALGNFPYLFRVVVTQSPSVTKGDYQQITMRGSNNHRRDIKKDNYRKSAIISQYTSVLSAESMLPIILL
jgi:hypothetical protein